MDMHCCVTSSLCTHFVCLFVPHRQVEYRKARTENFFVNLTVNGIDPLSTLLTSFSLILLLLYPMHTKPGVIFADRNSYFQGIPCPFHLLTFSLSRRRPASHARLSFLSSCFVPFAILLFFLLLRPSYPPMSLFFPVPLTSASLLTRKDISPSFSLYSSRVAKHPLVSF